MFTSALKKRHVTIRLYSMAEGADENWIGDTTAELVGDITDQDRLVPGIVPDRTHTWK